MRYLTLKELPDGTPAGREINIHEDIGRVLLLVDAVRQIEDDVEVSTPTPRRRYQRRDLIADES